MSPHFLAPPPEALGKEVNEEGEHGPPSGGQRPVVEHQVDSQSPPAVRSSSPPVPALMRKLTGLCYIVCVHFLLSIIMILN